MRPLVERLREVPGTGSLRWIGVRPARGVTMQIVETVEAIADRGLAGDRAGGGNRQVTLVQAEHLPVIGGFLGVPPISPLQLRRNLVIEGINLLALSKLQFSIGDVILVGTGPCAPCGKLDELIAPGGFQATRGHGGITARIVRGGTIRVGDAIRVVP